MYHEMTPTHFYLVGDIGGTNARFALITDQSTTLQNIATYAVQNYETFEGAVDAYLTDHGIAHIAGACIAFAGPVVNNEARMTNGTWHIKPETFCKHFDCEHFWLINDFVAQSMAIPSLAEDEVEALDDRQKDDNAPILVVGPGTGLGAGLLVKTSTGWQPCPGEGGHMDFAPASEMDIVVWRYLQNEHGRLPCWEDLLSGSGLESLYASHTGCDSRKAASEITGIALKDTDSLEYTVVQHFLTLLARYAGNLAVATGAKGGVYIAGGIVPRIKTLLDREAFRTHFEQRGKAQDFMKTIPVSLVMASHPGLTGSAAFLRNSHRA